MTSPICPRCKTVDTGPPGPLGVHLCRSCWIEFRPARRLPIRGNAATLIRGTGVRRTDGLWALLVIIGIGVGVGTAIVDGPSSPPPSLQPVAVPAFELPPIEIPPPPSFDPSTFAPLAPVSVTLPHELHGWRIEQGRLHASGIVRQPEDGRSLEDVRLEAELRGADGQLLHTEAATISCRDIEPGDTCAWAFDAAAPPDPAAPELVLHGQPQLAIWPRIELRNRFDADGLPLERDALLALEPERGRLRVRLPAGEQVLGGRATITGYTASGEVVDVVALRAETAWMGEVELELGPLPDGCSSYEARVMGTTMLTAVDPSW